MCGIFGVVRPRPGSIDWAVLQELARLNEMRGAKSSGFLVDSGLGKRVATFPRKRITEALYTLEDEAGRSNLRSILCHSKAPTIGEVSEETTQPVMDRQGTMILAHNGSILNWRSIDMTVSFDTPAILTAIGTPSVGSILRGLSRLEGQHACWLYLNTTQKIYLWRVMSPLFVREQLGGVWFSSVIPSGEHEDWEPLQEGRLFEIQTGIVVEQGSFEYSTIY